MKTIELTVTRLREIIQESVLNNRPVLLRDDQLVQFLRSYTTKAGAENTIFDIVPKFRLDEHSDYCGFRVDVLQPTEDGWVVGQIGDPTSVVPVGQQSLVQYIRHALTTGEPFRVKIEDLGALVLAVNMGLDMQNTTARPSIWYEVEHHPGRQHVAVLNTNNSWLYLTIVSGTVSEVTHGIPGNSKLFQMKEWIDLEIARHPHDESAGARTLLPCAPSFELQLLHNWIHDDSIGANHALMLTESTEAQVILALTEAQGRLVPLNYVSLDGNGRQLIAVQKSVQYVTEPRSINISLSYYTLGQVVHTEGKTLYLWKNVPGQYRQQLQQQYVDLFVTRTDA